MREELRQAEEFKKALNRATALTILWFIVKIIAWGMEPVGGNDAKR